MTGMNRLKYFKKEISIRRVALKVNLSGPWAICSWQGLVWHSPNSVVWSH